MEIISGKLPKIDTNTAVLAKEVDAKDSEKKGTTKSRRHRGIAPEKLPLFVTIILNP